MTVPGDNTGAVVEVACIGEGGQRPDRVVPCEFGETLHEIIQLIDIPTVIFKGNKTKYLMSRCKINRYSGDSFSRYIKPNIF